MRRAARHLLCRFPLLQTRALSAARDVTSRFWPKHTSVVLGPDDYALEMNRVLLGHVAVTFVACTSRIRVVSAAATTEYALYVPFEGDIHLVADGADLSASPDRPLLRGPTRAFVFEPSPIRCLIIDIPAALVAAKAGADQPLPRHASIAGPAATSLTRLAVQLANAAGRSRSLVALQGFSVRDRLARLPEPIRHLETRLVGHAVVAAAAHAGERGGCDVESLKDWLASHAHRRVRIAELSAVAGVSQRTVERAFLRSGCTPLDYLRRVRLGRACAMLTGPMKDLTVADVAAAVGYTHCGRFSEEYRRHFGENPSKTLSRRQARRRDS